MALDADLVGQTIVLMLELFVLVALLRVQVVQAGLVRKVDVIDLLLVGVKFILHVTLFGK